jgi:hypothetical protein
MGYIIKNTQGLVVTRLTDVGRRKISQGNFNISYFQVGDSEVSYTALTDYNFANSMVIEPSYNSQNNVGIPQSTKNYVKYPFYQQGTTGNTYGIPIQNSVIDEVFNSAAPTGFFQQVTQTFTNGTTNSECFQFLEDGVCYNSQYTTVINNFNGASTISLSSNPCVDSATNPISAGTKVAIWIQGETSLNATCNDVTILGTTNCVKPCKNILFYNVVNVAGTFITLDRPLPNFDNTTFNIFTRHARLFFYYSGASDYDLTSPMVYDTNSVINYESICYPTDGFVRVWNMNIPWSESPAGTTSANLTYQEFGSIDYLGLKEYYGYYNSSGQTDTSGTWYYNSFGERVNVTPEEQKTIAIVHYSNSSIINWYGEKFACETYDPTNPGATGQARNFQITIPWLAWHKNEFCCSSQSTTNQSSTTFYIDPPGFDSLDLLEPHYIQSSKNIDMNSPGIRYFHLYDTNEAYPDGPPNRVGKVFPDDKIIIFDDEEIVAALSYASNRNWTLPAPRLETVTPGSCGSDTDGLLNDDTECVWITYLFKQRLNGGAQGLHCNYYQKICGPKPDCSTGEQNVSITFGGDFGCMSQGLSYGWGAGQFWILAQKTNTTDRPDPAKWKAIDFTQTLSGAGFINASGYINPVGMTSLNFTISQSDYDSGVQYSLSNQIDVKVLNDTNEYAMNFGDETFFHGYIQTDIQATIYEMRYLINLPSNQFTFSSNPSWSEGITPYMTEIGLFDTDRNLLALGKFQSPQLRQGVQQLVLKLDF